MKNRLILYYSWSGNTRTVAGKIQEQAGGELFELELVHPYPRIYNACTDRAKQEIRTGHAPALKAMPDLDGTDTVFIGSPNWWSTMAPPVLTFLRYADLSGKTVVPFCTHGGGGKGRYVNDVVSQCGDSTVLDDLALYGDGGRVAASEIAAWLKRIGMIQNK